MSLLDFLGGKPNVPKLVEKSNIDGLIKALGYRKDAGIRKAAAEGLVKVCDCKGTFGVAGLIAHDRHANEVVIKTSVIEALKMILDRKPQDCLRALAQTLNDEDPAVRAAAAAAIGKICKSPAEIKALIWMAFRDTFLMKDPEVGVILEIIQASWSGKEFVDALARGLQDPDEAVRKAVVEALRAAGDGSVIAALSDAAEKDSSAAVREAAREVAEKLKKAYGQASGAAP